MTQRSWRVEVVSDFDRLFELQSSWLELFEHDHRATPFQSPDWLMPWLRYFAPNAQLRVIVLCAAGRLLVCLPLMLVERDGLRTLAWIGDGITDYLDAVIHPDVEKDGLRACLDALLSVSSEAEQVELNDIPAHSLLSSVDTVLSGMSLASSSICPRLLSCSAGSDFERSLPRWLLRNVRQTERRLAKMGRVNLERATTDNVGPLLEAFFELHSARWHVRGMAGVLADHSVMAFHRAAAPRLVARGALNLEVQFLDDQPVAASYVLQRAESYLYLTGFDPELEGLSLGSLLIHRAIASALERGHPCFDFLRGQEAYKYAWGARDTHSCRWLGPSPTARPGAECR